MAATKAHNKRKRSIPAKIGRFLLFFFLGILVILGIVAVAINLYMTNERLEKIASYYTAKAIPRQLSFQAAHFNILNGFVFENIQLQPEENAAPDSFPLSSAFIDKAVLRYSLRHILKKQFVIHKIELLNPDIEFNLIANLPDTVVVSQAITQPDTLNDIFIMPLSVQLRQLAIRNFTAHVRSENPQAVQEIYASRLSFELDDLVMPKDQMLSATSIPSGSIKLSLDNSELRFQSGLADSILLAFSATCESFFSISTATPDEIPISFKFTAQHINLSLADTLHWQPNFTIGLQFIGEINLPQQSAELHDIDFTIDKLNWLTLQSTIAKKDSLLNFAARISDSNISMQQIIAQAQQFSPLPLPELFYHHADAFLHLTGTQLYGDVLDAEHNNIHAEAMLTLDPFGVTAAQGEHIVQNLNINLQAASDIINGAPQQTRLQAKVQFDSVFVTLPDSTTQALGATQFTADATLNADLLPTQANIDLSINQILGAAINAQARLQSKGSIASLFGDGNLSVQHLQTGNLPDVPLHTNADIALDFHIHSLQNIQADLHVLTDSLKLAQPAGELAMTPLDFTLTLQAATKADFQKFSIDSCAFYLNNLLAGHLTAQAELSTPPAISCTIPEIRIDHQALWQIIPPVFLTGLEDLEFDGSSILAAKVDIPAQQPAEIHADFSYDTENMHLSWPLTDITINGIDVAVNGTFTNQNGAALTSTIKIDSLLAAQVRSAYFLNNSFALHAHSQDFTSFQLDSALVDLPSLNLHAFANATIYDPTIPRLNATVIVEQQAETPLTIMPDLAVRGTNKFIADVGLDSTLMSILASVRTDSLDIFLANNTRVLGLNADVHVEQQIDLTTQQLLAPMQKAIQTETSTMIDYFLHQNYFYETNLQSSSVRIDSVIFGEYSIENMRLIGYFGNGSFDIPMFTMDMLTGSIGGRFAADARNQTFDKTVFDLNIHFSDINSALLLPDDAKSHTRGKIRANAELHGNGLNFAKPDIAGFFYITQIQPRAADNLLRELDPEEKDSGVRWTRFLINRGFKPEIMAFDIRNGYCYPSIKFIQPWYFPVRLSGGEIELARIPLAYFFE